MFASLYMKQFLLTGGIKSVLINNKYVYSAMIDVWPQWSAGYAKLPPQFFSVVTPPGTPAQEFSQEVLPFFWDSQPTFTEGKSCLTNLVAF